MIPKLELAISVNFEIYVQRVDSHLGAPGRLRLLDWSCLIKK